MVYDEQLASKIRALVARRKGWNEKKMFGGLAFMLNGKMCCGVIKDELLIRVGPERHDDALALPNSRPMDFTGKPMKGFIFVDYKAWSKDETLKNWINMGKEYVSSLTKESDQNKSQMHSRAGL